MYMRVRKAMIAALVLAAGSALAARDTTPPDAFVVTEHEVDLGDRKLRYTARAGMLPLYENDTGELMARMLIIAYVAEPGRGEPPRPGTVPWDRGPRPSSPQAHLVRSGPQ